VGPARGAGPRGGMGGGLHGIALGRRSDARRTDRARTGPLPDEGRLRGAVFGIAVTSEAPRKRLSFYRRLGAEQKREYDRSDARRHLPLAPEPALGAVANEIVAALESGSQPRVGRTAQRLVDAICASLNARSR